MFDLFCAWGAGATVVRGPRARPTATCRRSSPTQADDRVVLHAERRSRLVRRMGGLKPGSMPTLRWSFFAGEALSCRDAADWQAAAPGSTLENLYGPTELTITITAHRWSAGATDACVNGVVPIGTVHPGTRSCCWTSPDAEPTGRGRAVRHRPADDTRLPRPGRRQGPVPGTGRPALVPHRRPGPLHRRRSWSTWAGWTPRSRSTASGRAGRDRQRGAGLPGRRGRGDRRRARGRHGRTRRLLHRRAGVGRPARPHLRDLLPAAVVPRPYQHVEDFRSTPTARTGRWKLGGRAAGCDGQPAGAGTRTEGRQESQYGQCQRGRTTPGYMTCSTRPLPSTRTRRRPRRQDDWTYRELAERSHAVARGCSPGRRPRRPRPGPAGQHPRAGRDAVRRGPPRRGPRPAQPGMKDVPPHGRRRELGAVTGHRRGKRSSASPELAASRSPSTTWTTSGRGSPTCGTRTPGVSALAVRSRPTSPSSSTPPAAPRPPRP